MDSTNTSLPHRNELAEVLEYVVKQATDYLRNLDNRPVRSQKAEEAAAAFNASLPEEGGGAASTLRSLIEKGLDAAVHSAGPNFFHFVVGGTTPAALGADWITSLLDQMAYAWVASPLAVQLELVSLSWLRDLFRLSASWAGIMTTGATMANFVGLAAARQWWGEQHGTNVAEQGLAGLPKIPVLTSGYIHASAIKALAMLGIGRSAVQTFSADTSGRLDLKGMEAALSRLDGSSAMIIGNAGEVNAGEFDPIGPLADLAEKYGAWLHVDGAFGLFARVSPRTAHLTEGVERAHSVTVDGHKWLNVPYDCGFGFVSDPAVLGRAFAYTAAYLPDPDDPHPNMGSLGPESSRRARSLAVWATLCAYGRQGYRTMVEQHLMLAQRMAQLVDEAPDLERLAHVPLNIVCFRYNPGGFSDGDLDQLNRRLGEAILKDGRVYAGTTLYKNQVALRPAIVNWRTTESDVDLFIEVVRELGAKLSQEFKNEKNKDATI
ncbi:aspartate aminotransferase family protein [candidate division KSB1 bacterium]|nr:aspartate aminotransferase family protein [candidate division KSB1 bacterium]NIR69533.1 aspartate aminotransferase family protein [candidate division KSB1 bacterium]NIS24301.1 aspartate aminotransferase family protein [candidate division KSB1 bacterium]NIT71216.1 aspartate aminotransferase family protein [candidate division KSB1 bacterium]NIU24920.1 aspartate aminotransferase family protein [candidate division KSB1 bacterium]